MVTHNIFNVYIILCDVADHYSRVFDSRPLSRHTRHHHDINMLHILTLPQKRIYPDPVGGGLVAIFKYGIIPVIPLPDG